MLLRGVRLRVVFGLVSASPLVGVFFVRVAAGFLAAADFGLGVAFALLGAAGFLAMAFLTAGFSACSFFAFAVVRVAFGLAGVFLIGATV